MALLEALKLFFMVFDGGFQLFYVFSPPLPECCLCLTIPLLSFLRGRVDLSTRQLPAISNRTMVKRLTGLRPPLRFWT